MDLLAPPKTSSPKSGGVLPLKVTEVEASHDQKAPCPILVTEFPIVTEVKASHEVKARSPILVTELGIFIEVRLVQL